MPIRLARVSLALLVGLVLSGSATGSVSPPSAKTAWLAKVVYASVGRSSPSHQASRVTQVPTVSKWGGIEQLLVVDTENNAEGSWLRVQLNLRPNQMSVWIPRDNVILSQTHWRINISRARHTLYVYFKGRYYRSWRVVVGKSSTPTPRGKFAIAGKLPQASANGFDGDWVLPLTAHSGALHSFDGGDGQVALHGRGGASLSDPLGTSRSHGCVRMSNADIAWLAAHMPVGTPVKIV